MDCVRVRLGRSLGLPVWLLCAKVDVSKYIDLGGLRPSKPRSPVLEYLFRFGCGPTKNSCYMIDPGHNCCKN